MHRRAGTSWAAQIADGSERLDLTERLRATGRFSPEAADEGRLVMRGEHRTG